MTRVSELFGLFQQFRPKGEGVERIFADVLNGDQYVSRLRQVYNATSDPACANDVYFVVRSPLNTTDSKLQEIGNGFIDELRAFAKIIRNTELSDYLQLTDAVEVVQKSQLNRSNDDNLLVMESIGDWLGGIGNGEDQILRMREAFYSIACDFFLMYYLQWPYYVNQCSRDVFRPYFELWRRGVEISFEGRCLQVG